MRDPVERFLSAYEFALQNAQRLLDKQTTSPPLSRLHSRRRRRRRGPPDDDEDDDSDGGGGGDVAPPLSNATSEAAAAPDGQRRYEGHDTRHGAERERCAVGRLCSTVRTEVECDEEHRKPPRDCTRRHRRLRHTRLPDLTDRGEHSPGQIEREHEGFELARADSLTTANTVFCPCPSLDRKRPTVEAWRVYPWSSIVPMVQAEMLARRAQRAAAGTAANELADQRRQAYASNLTMPLEAFVRRYLPAQHVR